MAFKIISTIKALHKAFLPPRRNQQVDSKITAIGNPDPRCPYCGKSLGKMPARKRPCPHCGNTFYVRTRPYDSKKVLVTTEQAEQVQEQWAIMNGVHDQYLSSKTERSNAYKWAKSELTKQFDSVPSENDIQWRMLGEEAMQHAVRSDWGLYRNTRFRMAELVRKERKHKTALSYYLWVCYLDLNGPDNAGGRQDYPDLLREFPPFNPKTAILAPGIIYYINQIIKKLAFNEGDVQIAFNKVAKQEYAGLKLPVSPEEAWKKLKKELFNHESSQ